MKMTLISPVEVLAQAHFGHNVDSKLLCSHIDVAEEKFLRSETSCFGEALYQLLLADAVQFTDYDSTVNYAVNAVVIYDGKLYKCIAPSLGSTPAEGSFWTATMKFSNAKYQELWDTYLWKYISLGVQHSSLFKRAYQDTSKGLVRIEGENIRAAENAGVKMMKEEILDNMNVLSGGIKRFMAANKADFPSNSSCEENTCSQPRRIGLKLKSRR